MIRKLKSLTSGEVINPDIVRENIPDGAVNTAKIEDRAVTEDKIENGAVTFNKIADGAISESKIQNDAISRNKIQNDAITTVNIEDGSITYQKLDSDLQKESYFIEGERIKTLNLFNVDTLENGGIDGLTGADVSVAGQCRSRGFINVEPNENYYYSKNTSNYGFYIYFYNNGVYDSFIDGVGDGAVLTIPDNVNQIRVRFNSDYTNLISTNIMINKGSNALPYQPYNGKILHQIDIEPKLLWENATPSVDFASGDITASENPLNYKYIVVMFKTYRTNDEIKIQKFGSVTGTTSFNGTFYTSSKLWNIARNITFTNGTTISLGSGVYQEEGVTDTSNGVAIPVAIYGTNVL